MPTSCPRSWTASGGTSLFVYLQPDNAGASSATLAGWTVDDLDQTMDELRSRGVHFESYDQPGIKRLLSLIASQTRADRSVVAAFAAG